MIHGLIGGRISGGIVRDGFQYTSEHAFRTLLGENGLKKPKDSWVKIDAQSRSLGDSAQTLRDFG